MLTKARGARWILLFILIFGLHQGVEFFINTNSFFGWLRAPVSLTIILAAVFFMKFGGSSFRDFGFLWPKKARRFFVISLFLAVVYVIIVLFVPGVLSWFEAFPGRQFSWEFLFEIVTIVLASIAAEMAFRGYIQVKLESAYGFYIALIVVSILSTLYMLPVGLYFEGSPRALLYQSLPLFAGSAFLCFFFRETRTLLCPMTFSATVALLITFTPLQPTAVEYTAFVSLISYVFLVPFMQAFVAEARDQEVRVSRVPVEDSADDGS